MWALRGEGAAVATGEGTCVAVEMDGPSTGEEGEGEYRGQAGQEEQTCRVAIAIVNMRVWGGGKGGGGKLHQRGQGQGGVRATWSLQQRGPKPRRNFGDVLWWRLAGLWSAIDRLPSAALGE